MLKTIITSNLTLDEIEMLCDNEYYSLVRSFYDSYPYIFETKSTRITFVHDSFRTFLHGNVELSEGFIQEKKDIVFDSIFKGVG